MDWWTIKIAGESVAHISRDIEGSKEILATRIFRRTKTFVSSRLWPAIDAIVKHHQDTLVKKKILSDIELKILDTIESEGSIRTDHLRKRLKLEAKENNSKFHRSLNNLESFALVAGVEDPHPEKHLHANIWLTWDTRTRVRESRASVPYAEALNKLLAATVDACVIAREDQVPKWFRWSSDMQAAKDQLLVDGTILKSGGYLISSKVGNVTKQ